jgi:acid phosphatase type 7
MIRTPPLRLPLLLILVSAPLLFQPAYPGKTIRALEPSSEPIHIRVLFESRPAQEAVVSWTTTAAGEKHEIYLCTEARGGVIGDYSRRLPSARSAPFTLRADEKEGGMEAHGHHVFLGDLEPATRYYLVVVSDGQASKEHFFQTAPADGSEVALLMVGDSRVGTGRTKPDNYRRLVNARMRQIFEEHPEIVAMAHGGDYTDRAYWSELYYWLKDHHEQTTTVGGRLLPILPARGNHDLDVGFEEIFWWPDRASNYYNSTQLNSETVLITLNTEISRGGDQRAWLEQELERLRPSMRWVGVQYHRPAWPSVRDFSSGASQREAWVPLFERHQVDFVFESHDHSLKRSHPIYENEINEEKGILYFGDGGGGVSQREPQGDRWYLAKVGRHHHVHLLRFGAERVEVVAIDHKGEKVDEFGLSQDRRTR